MTTVHTRPRIRRGLVVVAVVVLLVACGSHESPAETSEPESTPTVADSAAPVVGAVADVATDLAAPWSVAFLDADEFLVSERDSGEIVHFVRGQDGQFQRRGLAGTVEGVVSRPGAESGLLGLAVLTADRREPWVFAYSTSAADNRVTRYRWDGQRLYGGRVIVSGIPAAPVHDGGRMVIGPDGLLYVGTGDAAEPGLAQDPNSLAGKILRVTATGEAAPGNPTPGSRVYSFGHRNVQGLAFDGDGQLWASELGQSRFDEINRVVPGGNYGWPEVEGRADRREFIDPVWVFAPAQASPSGIAIQGDWLYMSSLRGRQLWQMNVARADSDESPVALISEEYGRLRDVVVPPGEDNIWVLTSNTDGRGQPATGDDRILALQIALP